MASGFSWGQGEERPSEPAVKASQDIALQEQADLVADHYKAPDSQPNQYLEDTKDSMFIDEDALKAKVRSSILNRNRPSYSVAQFYHKEDAGGIGGRARFIATHDIFQNTTLGVICFNALWMSIDTDWNKAETISHATWLFQFVEHSFCTYFFLEWVIRFLAFKNKCDGRKDGWFVFDSILVLLMVGETWILTIVGAFAGDAKVPFPTAILRLFRLLRLSRLTKMLRSVPNLLILLKGMMTATRTVGWVMCLQVILLYVFAILFVQLDSSASIELGDSPGKAFVNIPMAMWTLLIYGTFLDNLADFLNAVKDQQPGCLPIAMLFITMSALTVMNMLTGVLCDVVNAVAEVEKEAIEIENLRDQMQSVMHALDKDENKMISYDEFCDIVDNPDALKSMQDVDVDPETVVGFAELFFVDDTEKKELKFDEFIDMILKMRSSNEATNKDVLGVWKVMKNKMQKNYERIQQLKKNVDDLQDDLNSKLDRVKDDVDCIVAEIQKLKH